MKIGILGTGNVAQNLGELFLENGFEVVFGSRKAVEDKAKMPDKNVQTLQSAAQSEVVFFAIPYTAFAEVAVELKEVLKGKIVVDLTNPLNADWSPLNLGAENSAGETNAGLLPESKVVKAFNTIFADVMKTDALKFGEYKLTAFVAGEDADANRTVADLANRIGFDAQIVGGIKNARYLEALAHLNIQIAVGMQGGTEAGFAYLRR